MKLGLVGNTNRTSGLGNVNADLLKWLPFDSVLSCPSIKGQELWHQRQTTAEGQWLDRRYIIEYFEAFKPDVVLAVETFWIPEFRTIALHYGVRMTLIPMHEVYKFGRMPVDLFLCPNKFCFNKVQEPHKLLWPLPIDGEPFKFKQRKGPARRFLHNFGHGFLNDKRQTQRVIDAFTAQQRDDVQLCINTQVGQVKPDSMLAKFMVRYGYPEHSDPRVRFTRGHKSPAAAYAAPQVVIQPEAYAGYGRVILEAMLCGLPVITTNAPPMNEYVIEPTLLVQTTRKWLMEVRAFNAVYHHVDAAHIAAAVARLAEIDIEDLSYEAAVQAEKWLWTKDKADELVAILTERLT